MKLKENKPDDSLYSKDYFLNYISNEQIILEYIEIKAGKNMMREDAEHSVLEFILSGELDVSTAGAVAQRIHEKQLFLIPAGDNFYVKTITDIKLIRCLLTKDISLFTRFSVIQLQKYTPPPSQWVKKGIILLPIHELLFKELELIRDTLLSGISNFVFQRIKQETLFVELMEFYPKKELAMLFAPVIGKQSEFKNTILKLYPQVKNVKELVEMLHMSPSVFKRKFQDTFGLSAHQWLIQKKKEKLFRDIVMTDMSIIELAEKYRFSVNYMTTFCREHFGKSPTEMRLEYRE